MTEEERKIITREKHLGRVAQGHKLAAFMKKRKEEILRNKEQSTEQQPVQSTVQQPVQPLVQSTVQPSVQSTVQSNDTYVYGLVCLLPLPLMSVYFLHVTLSLKIKSKPMKNMINHQNDIICFRFYTIND